jgi:hypothetical protein
MHIVFLRHEGKYAEVKQLALCDSKGNPEINTYSLAPGYIWATTKFTASSNSTFALQCGA